MPTTTERYDALSARSLARGPLDPDELGRAMLDFLDHGVPPRDFDISEAVADIEEAAFLALGGDPDGPWCSLLDDLRTTLPSGEAGEQELGRRQREARRMILENRQGVIAQARQVSRDKPSMVVVW